MPSTFDSASAISSFSVSSSYSKKTETITFSNASGRECWILTDIEIVTTTYSKPFYSLHYVLQNKTLKLNTACFTTGCINVCPVRNIYITSYRLGIINILSVSGKRAIVKKAPVTANYGEFMFDESVTGVGYLDCSKQNVSRTGFSLSNIYGEPINLHGYRLSFPFAFARIQKIT
jgi:hypothetical protein